jgi:hypothetical protein
MPVPISSAASSSPGIAPPAAGETSFDAQVRGRGAKAIDVELARIAADVYQPASRGIDGWSRLGPADLQAAGIAPEALEDRTTGLRAAIYTDGEGRYALAFAGSNDIPDWLNNLAQGVGLDAAQYNQAIALAKDAKLAFGGELAITGHSLGGGLAAAAALATDSAAVTFNAAGVNDETLRDAGLDPAAARAAADNGQIRRYAVNGEVLTGVQEGVPLLRAALPDAPGSRIALQAPPLERPQNRWIDWLDGVALRREVEYGLQLAARPVTLHGMPSVLQALEHDHPWQP